MSDDISSDALEQNGVIKKEMKKGLILMETAKSAITSTIGSEKNATIAISHHFEYFEKNLFQ